MKKRNIVILSLIFLLAVGFAAVNTVLDLKGNVSLSHNEDDFRLEITNLIINGEEKKVQISEDKQSFTFIGSGNDSIDYTVTNYSYQYDTEVKLVCDSNCNVDQIGDLDAQSKKKKNLTTNEKKEITCTLNIDELERTSYAEEMCPYDEGQEWLFTYRGYEESITNLCSGNYKLETWGAQGGSTYGNGGYGAYSTGNIKLSKGSNLFINVGNQPEEISASYNGGAIGQNSPHVGIYISAGGGATHIALESGLLSNLESSLGNVLIVSGGGGGGIKYGTNINWGGNGGGYVGTPGTYLQWTSSAPVYSVATGGTQMSGGLHAYKDSVSGKFGKAEEYSAGGGLYGGGSGNGYNSVVYSGGGGSGYIGNPLLTDKAMYCYNCSTSNEESTKTISTTNVSSSPISGYAKAGHGYAKITYLGN